MPYQLNSHEIVITKNTICNSTMAQLVNKSFNYTFAMLKPDVANNPVARESIMAIIKANQFEIVECKQARMTSNMAQDFYAEHKTKFFHNRLVTFMSSAPIYALILAKEDAIAAWRSLIGPTNVYRAIYTSPDCLRSKFGLTDTRNAFHGSDSELTVKREASFFFPDFFT